MLVLTAQRHRTQERNRQEARERLAESIRQAAAPPVLPQAHPADRGSRRRRLDAKQRRSAVKKLRGGPATED